MFAVSFDSFSAPKRPKQLVSTIELAQSVCRGEGVGRELIARMKSKYSTGPKEWGGGSGSLILLN